MKGFGKGKTKKDEDASRAKNIAVVEDDELFSFQLNWKLNSVGNHIVNAFPDAASCFAFLEEDEPDIVFLDYFLPDANGSEIMDQIKEIEPEAKVIIISSQEDPKVAADFTKAGIFGYIVKDKDWKQKLAHYLKELNL